MRQRLRPRYIIKSNKKIKHSFAHRCSNKPVAISSNILNVISFIIFFFLGQNFNIIPFNISPKNVLCSCQNLLCQNSTSICSGLTKYNLKFQKKFNAAQCQQQTALKPPMWTRIKLKRHACFILR